MSRRFYMVSYDISDDKRRTRIARALLDYGDRVQYSVFCCQLSDRERVLMKERLKEWLLQTDDQVLILDAGTVDGANPRPDMEHLGRPYEVSPRSQIV